MEAGKGKRELANAKESKTKYILSPKARALASLYSYYSSQKP